MKRLLAACLVIALAMSLGCGNGEESREETGSRTEVPRVTKGSLIDPVDGKPVNIHESEYSWIYEDTEYHFNTKENFEKFKEDPEKYVSE